MFLSAFADVKRDDHDEAAFDRAANVEVEAPRAGPRTRVEVVAREGFAVRLETSVEQTLREVCL